MNLIKKVKTRPVDQMVPCGLVFSPKENGRSKYALKALHYTPAVTAILGKPEKIQNLGCALEVDRLAFLPKGQRCNPDGNQAVLAER